MTFENPFTAPFQRQTFDEVFFGEDSAGYTGTVPADDSGFVPTDDSGNAPTQDS